MVSHNQRISKDFYTTVGSRTILMNVEAVLGNSNCKSGLLISVVVIDLYGIVKVGVSVNLSET